MLWQYADIKTQAQHSGCMWWNHNINVISITAFYMLAITMLGVPNLQDEIHV